MMSIAYGVPHLPQATSHFEALNAVHHIMVWQTSMKWDLMCLFLKLDCECYYITLVHTHSQNSVFNFPEWLVPFKRTIRVYSEQVRNLVNVPFNESKQKIVISHPTS